MREPLAIILAAGKGKRMGSELPKVLVPVGGRPMIRYVIDAVHGAGINRILVVVELSGGNDGLNTLVPFGDDAYYKHRPTLGIRPDKLRKIDDHFGWNSGMAGFEKLYKDGKLAVIHGCGYDQPSFSHFTSMAYLHTAAPNSGEEYGWVGRLGDALQPKTAANFIVNIDATQSLAVKSHVHVPVVFDEPERFTRKGSFQEKQIGRAHV